jgi:hypothetical protein
MVLKKVLLGFVTTTSLILLVMVAPTTTTTASLQQEGNATIDEPNIPIGPADEEEEEDEEGQAQEPILPDNENNDTDRLDEPPILREPIPPLENETRGGVSREANETTAGNVTAESTTKCVYVPTATFKTDKKTYKQGEDVTVSALLSQPPVEPYSVRPQHNAPLVVR